MKHYLALLAVVSTFVATTVVLAREAPTDQQLQNLFESLSKVTPDKIHIVSLHLTEQARPNAAEVEKRLGPIRKLAERLNAGMAEPLRSKMVEEMVQMNRATMTGRDFVKCEEWKSGSLYRVDKAVSFSSLLEADVKTNNTWTLINLERTNRTTSTVTINHDTKSFEKDSRGTPCAMVGAWKGITIEDRVMLGVLLSLASKESIQQVAQKKLKAPLIDSGKKMALAAGADPNVRVFLEEIVLGGLAVHSFKFEILSKTKGNGQASFVVECNKTNYNQIMRTQVTGGDGIVRLASTRKHFDAQDVPHEYVLIEYGDKEKTYTTNTFYIKSVELNAQFVDDEVFRFEPPKRYGVVDKTGGKIKIESFPDGKTPSKIIDLSKAQESSGLSKRLISSAFVAGILVTSVVGFAVYRHLKSKNN